MFLTTNRVRDFDDAVQSRITLGLRYETLAFDTRRTVWDSLLKRASNASGPAKYDGKDLVQLAKREVNGRQVCHRPRGTL